MRDVGGYGENEQSNSNVVNKYGIKLSNLAIASKVRARSRHSIDNFHPF